MYFFEKLTYKIHLFPISEHNNNNNHSFPKFNKTRNKKTIPDANNSKRETVNYDVDSIKNDDMTTEHFSILDPALFKPYIINALPKTYSSIIGAQAKFTCLTTVLFPVECEWYLNGQLVNKSRSNGRIYTKDNNKTLMILSLRDEDHGQLVMVARNPFGKAKTKCRLSIFEDESAISDVDSPESVTLVNKDSSGAMVKQANRLQNKSTKLCQDPNVQLSRGY